jgi:hypothetical protein
LNRTYNTIQNGKYGKKANDPPRTIRKERKKLLGSALMDKKRGKVEKQGID